MAPGGGGSGPMGPGGGGGLGGAGGQGGFAGSTTTGPPCTSHAQCDDGVPCTVDTCQPDGCHNDPDAASCDDGVLCTVDTCTAQGCTHVFSNAPCDDGIACSIDTCDPVTDSCVREACDSLCDDGVFCNGIERCDTSKGCVGGAPSCKLSVSCGMDACAEASEQCTHLGQEACVQSVRLLVTDSSGALWELHPLLGTSKLIAAAAGGTHYDIAILGARWFALNPGSLVELTPMTNQVLKTFPSPGGNSLAAGPGGKLYAASSNVYEIDPDTGASKLVGPLPAGFTSSGDIAFLDGVMYISTNGPCGGALVTFDLATGSGKPLGGDGLGCVYGLAVAAGVLYILNCDGKAGVFDPKTGAATVLSTSDVATYGADTLP
jgi:hypothetical protein